ncbi:hypothetical protein FTUN_3991 [Frigoriglobus tundricola]|uniref:Uncharacterized protein n=1 Tax=Frigoriglobus tundricola TaxID=2774151 RepID=A0A6M5YSM7_9BACT|nr:hypothetical protein FTUN_3991 [Frigoriglobus tundricola]
MKKTMRGGSDVEPPRPVYGSPPADVFQMAPLRRPPHEPAERVSCPVTQTDFPNFRG